MAKMHFFKLHYLTLLLFVLFVLPVWSKLIHVTWNGTEVTGPSLIFHDEIQVINSTDAHETGSQDVSGALWCLSDSNAGLAWYFTDASQVPDSPATIFQQMRVTLNSSLAILSRGTAMHDVSDQSNGLWICRLNQSSDGEALVGIYHRDGRDGILDTISTMLIHSMADFLSDAPHFTIVGMTSGGPPTDYRWSKDGLPLPSNTTTFNVTIAAIPQNMQFRYQDTLYESTLIVSGREPGLYQYTATNRLSPTLTDMTSIEVADNPTNPTVQQTGNNEVEVSWAAPPTPPRFGYFIDITGVENFSIQIRTATSPHSLQLEPGTYRIQIRALSEHYPSDIIETADITIRDAVPSRPPENVMYVAGPRYVVFSWSPVICSQCSAPITDYLVDFTSAAGTAIVGSVVNETFTATQLVPYTEYTFRVASVYSNGTGPFSSAVTIRTDEDTPGPVANLTSSSSRTAVKLTWDPPIDPNGVIIIYQVTYSINNSRLVTVNTTEFNVTSFDITVLSPNTTVSNISVSAYTRSGQGEPAYLDDTTTRMRNEFSINYVTIIGVVASFLILVMIFLLIAVIGTKMRWYWCPTKLLKSSNVELDGTKMGPVVDIFPEDTFAIEGEGLLLPVSVRGHPKPTIVWFFEGVEVTKENSIEIQQDGSLFISLAQLRHTGHYRLLARNTVGIVEKSFSLFVKLRELRRVLTMHNGTVLKPVPLEEFGEYVEENHAQDNKGFKNQYLVLFTGQQYSKFIGTHSRNVNLNRYANVIVYDHNRIALNPLPENSEWSGDYINACYIDGYSTPREFIAAQGPKPETIIDFWRLVWQERPPTIVMMTNLKEGNKRKCDQYWPDGGSMNYGPFKITLIEQEVLADYCIRTLLVNILHNTAVYWEVKQFHFLSWSDHGVPDSTSIMLFLKDMKSWHNRVLGPMLVHCSAGVGRTGAFICLSIVQEQIQKERLVDIPGIINKMRHQRMKMVNLPDQYIFLHDVILKATVCGSTEVWAANFKRSLKRWTKQEAPGDQTMLGKQFTVLGHMTPNQRDVVCVAALENSDKNRSKHSLPADKYRVLLLGENPDYIHAVYVNGYNKRKAFIISEGPMESTVRNWCKMICDNKCGAVVMLSSLVETNKECSTRYWPLPIRKMTVYDDYRVHLVQEQQHTGVTTRLLKIYNMKTKHYHQVIQFHVTCWRSDGHVNNLDTLIEVIDEVASVQKQTGNVPILIHCCDTVTRSAMFCTAVTVIDRWKTEGVVDIFQVVKDLRMQKPGAVPTLNHYRMIYTIVFSYLRYSNAEVKSESSLQSAGSSMTPLPVSTFAVPPPVATIPVTP